MKLALEDIDYQVVTALNGKKALENLAPGGGFILGPGCALPPTTPDENIDAMIETAKAYKLE